MKTVFKDKPPKRNILPPPAPKPKPECKIILVEGSANVPLR